MVLVEIRILSWHHWQTQKRCLYCNFVFSWIYNKYENGELKSRTNRELEEMSKGENIVKWIKGQRISWLGHRERMEDAQNDLHSRTGRDEKKGKTQEKMERGNTKRSSSAGSEKMERVGGR